MKDLSRLMADLAAQVLTLSVNHPNDTDLGKEVRSLINKMYNEKEGDNSKDGLETVQEGSK